MIEKSLEMSRRSEGAFDITFAAMHGLWKFDEDMDKSIPLPEEIAERRKLINWRDVLVNAKAGTVKLRRAGMRMGLGGIAKGYAVDRCSAVLRAAGLENFMVQAGGDLYVAGRKGNANWMVGVRDPRGGPRDIIARMPIQDHAFSTAGDYERGFVLNGRRYHHIIDPKTGYPATASREVTIFAPNAFLADALDDSVFILGPKKGMELVDSYPDCATLIVDAQNKVWISKSLEGKLQRTAAPTDGILMDRRIASDQARDVAIIGGGIMGSAVALRLCQRGIGVTVIERGIPGAEASSAAAGILGPQMEAEGPGPLLELGLKSRALYPALAAELRELTGIDVGYDRSGVLAVAFDEAGEAALVGAARLAARRAGCASTASRARRRARGSRRSVRPCARRWPSPTTRRWWRAELARAFSQAAAGAGARFLTGRYVRRVLDRQGRRHRRRARRRRAAGRRGGGRRRELVGPGRRGRGAAGGRPPGARPAGVDRDAPAAVSPRRLGARRLPGPAPRRHGPGRQHRRDGRLPQGGHRRRPGRDPDAGPHVIPALADAPVTGVLVQLPALHRGSPAGPGRHARPRPGARHRPLPQRHPPGARSPPRRSPS